MRLLTTIGLFFLTIGLAFAQEQEGVLTNERTDAQKIVHIYPNPTTDYLQVKFEAPLAAKARLTLLNILGSEVTVEIEPLSDHEVRLKVKDLPSGYYLLSIKDEDTRFRSTLKFLKR